jgi:Leucine-rich repeat (LRR) protein
MLQKIAEIIDEYVEIEIDDKGKGFSKFMMLYHPDKADFHIAEINKLVSANNFDKLLEYSHIFKLERIDEIANALNSYEDIDYAPVYDWDAEVEGFRIMNDDETTSKIYKSASSKKKGLTFYDAVKIRHYGHTNIEYPTYYLEDIDEFELSSSDIDDLEGIQFCKHAKTVDLSDNLISDISLLSSLSYIEELNLSENEICDIDSLSNLTNLHTAYLNNNYISDISPLFELPSLELVELIENKVNITQVEQLRELGVTVII